MPGAILADAFVDGVAVAAGFATILGTIVLLLPPVRKFLSRWRIFYPWILTKKELLQQEEDRLEQAVVKTKIDSKKTAVLTFELVWVSSGVEVVVRNKGQCEARNVIVLGERSPRYWEIDDAGKTVIFKEVGEFDVITPGESERTFPASIEAYQIQGGNSSNGNWLVRANWDDDAGEHRDREYVARRAPEEPSRSQ